MRKIELAAKEASLVDITSMSVDVFMETLWFMHSSDTSFSQATLLIDDFLVTLEFNCRAKPYPCLRLHNISLPEDMRSQGLFTMFISKLECLCDLMPLTLEVSFCLNPALFNYFLKRNYNVTNEDSAHLQRFPTGFPV
jgi:hypothetical protein